jgi:hypothetical protein
MSASYTVRAEDIPTVLRALRLAAGVYLDHANTTPTVGSERGAPQFERQRADALRIVAELESL